MSYCTKRNRKTGEWEIVPPPRIDPMEWPFIIFFGLIGLGLLACLIAAVVVGIEHL